MSVDPKQTNNSAAVSAVLLDTNIVLNYFLASRPKHDAALRFISQAYTQQIPLIIAATSLKDFYYLYCLEIKRAMRAEGKQVDEAAANTASALAWGCIDNITKIATVASMGPGDAYVATKLRSMHDDFEDNYILATAMRCNVSHIATNDKKLREHSTIAAVTCEELLLILDL